MYQKRLTDTILQNRLRLSGAVLIQGAKGCGKTETALQAAKSSIRMDVDDDIPTLIRRGTSPCGLGGGFRRNGSAFTQEQDAFPLLKCGPCPCLKEAGLPGK